MPIVFIACHLSFQLVPTCTAPLNREKMHLLTLDISSLISFRRKQTTYEREKQAKKGGKEKAEAASGS
jgi:hypothetical protein